jgi:hypothetical protein
MIEGMTLYDPITSPSLSRAIRSSRYLKKQLLLLEEEGEGKECSIGHQGHTGILILWGQELNALSDFIYLYYII